MLTKLEAVNQMLEAALESPVNSLSSGLDDADKAERVLDRVSKEVQARGWSVNTDFEKTLKRDQNNRIPIANEILRVDTTLGDAHIDVVVRRLEEDGKKYLYDRDDNTFEFDQDLTVNIVWEYDFEALTPEAQMYVAAKAARTYQEQAFGSVSLDSFVRRHEMETWAAFQDAEAETEDANVFHDSPYLRAVTHRKNQFRSK